MSGFGGRSAPLYQRVADDIVIRIDTGIWLPGVKLPSERELCEQYDVSLFRVRRALRELSHDGLVFSRHGLGWFVSDVHPVDETVHEVSLVLDALNPLSAALVEALVPALGANGTALRLLFSEDEEQSRTEALVRAQALGAEVALVAISGQEQALQHAYARALRHLEIPTIFVFRQVPNLHRPAVVIDEEGAMARLTRHLLSMQHERIAYAGSDPATIEGWQRYHGFAATLWGKGFELPLDWVFNLESGGEEEEERLIQAFAAEYRPSAVVCSSDAHALRAMHALGRVGLYCPTDYAIVAVGGGGFAPWLPTPLTTVIFDTQEMAEAIAVRVAALLDSSPVDSLKVSGELQVRKSCGAALRDSLFAS